MKVLARTLLPAVLGVVLQFLTTHVSAAAAAQPMRLAVVELRNQAELSPSEIEYLTDLVRTGASRVLPSDRFIVMTRESIVALLPPGTTLADCAKGQCEVEVGRTIGADYIVTGEVLRFSDELRMNLKVHACQSGAFLGSATAKGVKLTDLEVGVEDACGVVFALVRGDVGRSALVAVQSTASTAAASAVIHSDGVTKKTVVPQVLVDLGAVVVFGGLISLFLANRP